MSTGTLNKAVDRLIGLIIIQHRASVENGGKKAEMLIESKDDVVPSIITHSCRRCRRWKKEQQEQNSIEGIYQSKVEDERKIVEKKVAGLETGRRKMYA
jgi:hypothetical protein